MPPVGKRSPQGIALAEELGSDVTALVFGENARSIAAEAGHLGATHAFICSDEVVNEYQLEAYAPLMTQLVKQHQAAFVLAVASNRGRELLASSAVDNESGLIADATDLRLENGRIIARRPAYAGKVSMQMTSNTANNIYNCPWSGISGASERHRCCCEHH